jgi:hypothetical protein
MKMQERLILRAKARAALQGIGCAPSIAIRCVAPPKRDAAGKQLTAPIRYDTRAATIRMDSGEKTFERGAGESTAEFEERCCEELPAVGPPALLVFWPRKSTQ